jgi:uncharacterized protein involved in exopolysaccharide biosynthesis
MAEFEDILGREIASAINDMVVPLRRRIEVLEARATMADQLTQLETRLAQLEQREPAKPTLRVVGDGHG